MKNIIYIISIIVLLLQSCANETQLSGAYPISMPQELKDIGSNITVGYEILKLQTGEKDTLLADVKK